MVQNLNSCYDSPYNNTNKMQDPVSSMFLTFSTNVPEKLSIKQIMSESAFSRSSKDIYEK